MRRKQAATVDELIDLAMAGVTAVLDDNAELYATAYDRQMDSMSLNDWVRFAGLLQGMLAGIIEGAAADRAVDPKELWREVAAASLAKREAQ